MSFYEPIPDDHPNLQQGSIVYPVPFVGLGASEAQVIEGDDAARGGVTTVDLTIEDGEHRSGHVVVRFELGTGIVITQTCDIERRDRPVTLARVRPFEEIYKALVGSKSFFDKLKNAQNPGKAPAVFWLPGAEGPDFTMTYSLASLLELQTFSPADLPVLGKVERLRLSPSALGAFQERIAFCFGRHAIPDDLYVNESIRAAWEQQRKKPHAGIAGTKL